MFSIPKMYIFDLENLVFCCRKYSFVLKEMHLGSLPTQCANSFSDLYSGYLKTIDHLNTNLLIYCRHIASFKIFEFSSHYVRNFEFSPM